MRSASRPHSLTDPAAPAPPSSAGAALLSAAAASVLAAIVVAGAAGAVLVLTGHDRVSTGTGPAPLLAVAAFACATVAALLVLNRGLHPAAAAAVWAVAAAWPPGGHAWLAIPAVLLIAAIAHVSGGRDLYGPPAIAAATAAVVLLGAAAATASLHDNPRPSDRGLTPNLTLNPRPPSQRGQTPSQNARPSGGGMTPDLTPVAVVRAYYAELDAREFGEAWARLSPAVQAGFGGFARWRDGFAATVASTPEELSAAGGVVRLVLVARDRCGGNAVITRRFAVQWRLERAPSGWRAAALTAAALPAAEAACVSR